MRFHYKKGATSKRRYKGLKLLLLLVVLASFMGGMYLLLLALSPNVPVFFPVQPIEVKSLSVPEEDRLYIPGIGVNVMLGEGEASLDDGAWHRYPERGDPVNGGNFIVAAHRFEIGFTPGETRRKSPFYHIDKLKVGDQILVDFQKKRYGYEITQRTTVKPTQVEIEAPLPKDAEPKLTLYTCTLKGEADGREVFIAKALGEVDSNGNITPN